MKGSTSEKSLASEKAAMAESSYWFRLCCGCLLLQEGAGTANTALAFHNNQLLALHEGDLPIAVSALLILISVRSGQSETPS